MRIASLAILLMMLLAGCADDSGGTQDDGSDDGSDDGTGDDGDAGDDGAGDDGAGADPSENETEERPVVQVEVAWDGAYAGPATSGTGAGYDQDTLTVPANSTVELTFVNNDPASSHDIAVEGIDGAASQTIGSGESVTITFDVGAPQETAFYCTIPGHRGNGMEGAFIIE